MALNRRNIVYPVTLFYDGSCPLCMKEVHWLQSRNQHHRLLLEDITSENFRERFPDLDVDALDRFLHVRLGNGDMLKGVDATWAVWSSVGRGWVIAPLRWPLLAYLADACYALFAAYRHKLGDWFFSKRMCSTQACGESARKNTEQK
ncbi:hypothetical protein CI610_01832 [invertebrate metagenome]|uniref:Cell division inhibitor n=1 Tax=invertebrate metagenome TaxID=1711999 RepID=A0A2H9T7M7_9ZZZZ